LFSHAGQFLFKNRAGFPIDDFTSFEAYSENSELAEAFWQGFSNMSRMILEADPKTEGSSKGEEWA